MSEAANGALVPGDRIRLSGGYDMEPEWLGGHDAVMGSLAAFIPGQNREPAALVQLDHPLEVQGITGERIVLELRYVGATWTDEGVVHVELCDFEPEAKTWSARRQGKWVESHATYTKLGREHANP